MSVSRQTQSQRQKYNDAIPLKTDRISNVKQVGQNFIPFVRQRDHLGRLIARQTDRNVEKAVVNKGCEFEAMSRQTNFNRAMERGEIRMERGEIRTVERGEIRTVERMQATFSYKFLSRTGSEYRIKDKNKVGMRRLSVNCRRMNGVKEGQKMHVGNNAIQLWQSINHKEQLPIFNVTQPASTSRPSKISSAVSDKVGKKQRKSSGLQERVQSKVGQLKIIAPQHYIKDMVQSQQIGELNQYKTSKRLSMKISTDLQESHNHFMAKMKQAKILAHQIQMGLDSIE